MEEKIKNLDKYSKNTEIFVKKIEKIQNINYSIEQLREDAKGFGQKINIFRGTRSSPQGNLTFSYIPDGITNENRLGFNVGHFNKNFNTWVSH